MIVIFPGLKKGWKTLFCSLNLLSSKKEWVEYEKYKYYTFKILDNSQKKKYYSRVSFIKIKIEVEIKSTKTCQCRVEIKTSSKRLK